MQNILAQANPAANTLTDLYTASSSVPIAGVRVSNANATPVTIDVAYAPLGAADAASQYRCKTMTVGPKQPSYVPLGLLLANTDKIRVKASAAGVAFALMG